MKFRWNAAIAILASSILGAALTSSAVADSSTNSQSAPASTSSFSSDSSFLNSTIGIFSESSINVKSGIVANAAVPSGYCQINLGNVHISNFAPGSVAANAQIQCASGQSIRVSSFVITLHKAGLIDHYFTGPIYGGVATYYQPLMYNDLKVVCSDYTGSTYWSTAHAVGVYSDGHSVTADAISPALPLPCGTNF